MNDETNEEFDFAEKEEHVLLKNKITITIIIR